MSEQVTLQQLQLAADEVALNKSLKPAGIGSLIFGALAVWAGWVDWGADPFSLALLLLGLLLLSTGLWQTFSPRPKGLISNGIALILVGIYNVGYTVWQMSVEGEKGFFFLILGFLQVLWGGQNIKKYPRFASMAGECKDKELLDSVRALMEGAVKGKVKRDPGLIEFQAVGLKQGGVWKGRLMDSYGLFMVLPRWEAVFLLPEQVAVEVLADKIGKRVKARIRLGDVEREVTVDAMSLDRLQRWLGEVPELTQETATP